MLVPIAAITVFREKRMFVIRWCKVVLIVAIASFFTSVAVDNVIDYNVNWDFVQHVMAMDTIFPQSTLRWRAITDPTIQRTAYHLIIATQTTTAVLLWIGVIRLLAAIKSARFGSAKAVAAAGLTLGLLLYTMGFVVIAGEWFAMWQSKVWNSQQTALSFIIMISGVLVILLLPDESAPSAQS
jgi:predicted small integral membrane protein